MDLERETYEFTSGRFIYVFRSSQRIRNRGVGSERVHGTVSLKILPLSCEHSLPVKDNLA